MEQKLYALSLYESNDMGIQSHHGNVKSFTLDELQKGEKLLVSESWGQPDPTDASYMVHLQWFLETVELTDEKLVFDFSGQRFTLNRQWQVLGTGSYGIPNAMIHESKRFIFYFATEEKSTESQFDKLQQLYNQMSENSNQGDFWKNIPLAKEALHLIKDVAPAEDDENKTEFCELVVDEDLLDPKSTPRLMLSFMDLWHALKGNSYRWDNETYQLVTFLSTDMPDEQKIDIMRSNKKLLYDPIQFSEHWEEVIYDVEKECEERLKDERRGMGFCFTYWSVKRSVLAKYGIEWRSPATMNPGTRFD